MILKDDNLEIWDRKETANKYFASIGMNIESRISDPAYPDSFSACNYRGDTN